MHEPESPLRSPPLVRWLLLALALISLGAGIVGLFLPVIPTVPFVLLAAWAAARSSPRLSRWMEQHPKMGPWIRDWRAGGVVPRKAKWTASVLMTISGALMLLTAGPRWFVWAAIGVMAAVLAWLWQRPEQAPD
jgi:uncharacterized membrane protein YbaN (DUF454 family)